MEISLPELVECLQEFRRGLTTPEKWMVKVDGSHIDLQSISCSFHVKKKVTFE